MKGRNKRDNKSKYLLILLLLIAVGYAAIATTLKINGSADIKSARWNVYWENPQVLSGSVNNTPPTLSESDTKATFDVTLNEPGEYYEFTIDAVNNGSLDAKIDTNGIVKQVKNSSGEVVNPTILKYEVTNNDQEHTAIEEGHILAKKSGSTPTKETYRVRVEYRNDEGIDPSDLENGDLVFTIEFSVKYVQGPKTVPVKTWNRYYTPLQQNGVATLPEGSDFWAQENTETSEREVCFKNSTDSICFGMDTTDLYNNLECEEDPEDGGCKTHPEDGGSIYTGKLGEITSNLRSIGFECREGDGYVACRSNDNGFEVEFGIDQTTVGKNSDWCYITSEPSDNEYIQCWDN